MKVWGWHTDECAGAGVFAAQLTRRPGDGFGPGDLRHPAARRNWYEAVGLVVAFDLPHAGESAQIAALDERRRDEALARLEP